MTTDLCPFEWIASLAMWIPLLIFLLFTNLHLAKQCLVVFDVYWMMGNAIVFVFCYLLLIYFPETKADPMLSAPAILTMLVLIISLTLCDALHPAVRSRITIALFGLWALFFIAQRVRLQLTMEDIENSYPLIHGEDGPLVSLLSIYTVALNNLVLFSLKYLYQLLLLFGLRYS